MFCDIK